MVSICYPITYKQKITYSLFDEFPLKHQKSLLFQSVNSTQIIKVINWLLYLYSAAGFSAPIYYNYIQMKSDTIKILIEL